MTEPFRSPPALLALHAVRLKGMGDVDSLAGRFSLDRAEVAELLLDFEAYGWVRRAEFADLRGWGLTDAGRAANEQQLAEELGASGARAAVTDVHQVFLPINARFQTACTSWQIRPLPGAPLAANDHTDVRWDDRVLDELGALGGELRRLEQRLTERLVRFAGYGDRFAAALGRVERGERSWVDGVGVDSCHAVWMELHEDLLATLVIARGEESSGPARGGAGG